MTLPVTQQKLLPVDLNPVVIIDQLYRVNRSFPPDCREPGSEAFEPLAHANEHDQLCVKITLQHSLRKTDTRVTQRQQTRFIEMN